MFGYRVFRLGAAAILIAATVMTVSPYIFSYVSTSAVVNAPLTTVKSPYDGTITTPSLEPGHLVTRTETLLRLSVDEYNRLFFNDLLAEQTNLNGELRAVRSQRKSLESLKSTLRFRLGAHKKNIDDWLEARLDEATADLRKAEIEFEEAVEVVERNKSLVAKGALSKVAFDDAEQIAALAEKNIEIYAAQLEALSVAKSALAEGIVLQADSSGFNNLQDRIDQVEVRLSELNRQKTSLETQLSAINRKIASLNSSSIIRDVYSPAPQIDGIIWRPSPPSGTRILAGDEIAQVLNCDKRFMLVAISERHFEKIHPGSTAHFRLKGSQDWLNGTVHSIRGANSAVISDELAAKPGKVDDDQLSVQIALPKADLSDPVTITSFCDVGRTADVRFDRSGKTGIEVLDNIFAGLKAGVLGRVLHLASDH
ncbi:MAG: HlyD family secretion protein [Mangrovicoccus sp.]